MAMRKRTRIGKNGIGNVTLDNHRPVKRRSLPKKRIVRLQTRQPRIITASQRMNQLRNRHAMEDNIPRQQAELKKLEAEEQRRQIQRQQRGKGFGEVMTMAFDDTCGRLL